MYEILDSLFIKKTKFNISLIYTLLRHNKDYRSWWNKVDDHIILGAIPLLDGEHDVKLIKDNKINTVLSLIHDFEYEPLITTPVTKDKWIQNNINFYQVKCEDFNPPSIENIIKSLEIIEKEISNNNKIYIHCKAGVGRSVCIVLCYLSKKINNKDFNYLYNYLKVIRPQINCNKMQRERVIEYLSLY